ncbi:hypothetical protein I4U23_012659 [Adineta vaga]|nr:hypothetical protein I4U23_012659 [Adineta vaga]
MSNTSNVTSYVTTLQNISNQITLFMSVLILLLGLIGNLLNCFVFIQRSLRFKPCVIYFLLASISNLIVIISGVTPRALQSFFMFSDRTETVPVFCKLRIIILFTMRTISSWLLTLATIDRYLISNINIHRRQMSNLKNTYYWIGIVSFSSILIWAQAGYCFNANLIGTPQKCYAKSDACRVFNDLAQSLITTIIPAGIILIFVGAVGLGAYELWHHHHYGNFGFGNPNNHGAFSSPYGASYGYNGFY